MVREPLLQIVVTVEPAIEQVMETVTEPKIGPVTELVMELVMEAVTKISTSTSTAKITVTQIIKTEMAKTVKTQPNLRERLIYNLSFFYFFKRN
jgi:hypothetical protein